VNHSTAVDQPDFGLEERSKRVPREGACPEEPVLRAILSAMVAAVSAPAAFVCMMRADGRTSDLAYAIDGRTSFAVERQPLGLLFGLSQAQLTAVRVTSSKDVLPDKGHTSYWREHSISNQLASSLLVSLRLGETLQGVAGVERRAHDRHFVPEDLDALRNLEPLLLQAQAARRVQELEREIVALRAIGDVSGTVLVVDCDQRRVVRASPQDVRSSWNPASGRLGKCIVDATLRLVAESADPWVGTPLRVGTTVILSVAPLAGPQSTAPRYVAVHVARAADRQSACDKLSPRELEVAHLLVEGYSNVNIAARCGVTPNTVRTFMRRLYAKLGVFNRADLVREVTRRPSPL
jgi:DNA-binding CsgD family transcriptional regulator